MRTRAKIFGTASKPRLSVFRGNRYTCIQLIDDEKGNTLASASTRELKKKDKRTVLAEQLGELIAKKAVEKGIEKAVFDRSFYKYHGRVKAIAEGARKGGLKL
ncbi:MAG: 50S ribosomal protein L18 [Candidatus Wolfebacteria bacterium GW2011_GWA2_42_10]|uniref:Large ribosomal subunit protein uL18 n=2 Tax=Candidatus Wolfeibacteriota TaxID=1752735 RepID=A0A0G0ZUG1_9BACT|nr:MAG: 50S ribosomal protein L18 [Candidatus Wolfebacteria bacterium GW2011_GWB1_41_12]KKS25626.1 MAG: 50S ribosomal protein L18 [Candidatus Wolfebacteria bacterium GW2011_GWA2_42_10]KKT56484.1 MAG: 50S ribosomal protein L18 [Candidatus Wolfebacteria bacterium GW2011_GWA1_44_24]